MHPIDGFASAFGEITLVLFTTLAPAGIVAYVIMALPLVVRGDGLGRDARRRLDASLGMPVVVAMVGLVASATHLGNPANALYIVAGLGRSPLSNEVVCGVAFLGAAGVFWLTSFSESGGNVTLRRVAAAAVLCLGVVFLGAISLAYSADAIITWNSPLPVASLWLNALAAGPLLAVLGFRLARLDAARGRGERGCVALAAAASAACVAVYAAWGAELAGMENALAAARDLAPAFGPMVGLFALLACAGVALGAWAASPARRAPRWALVASPVCVLAGVFVMRFAFYMVHMTAGLGV